MRSNPSSVRAALTAAASITLALTAIPALAGLGSSADSVSTDSSVLRGVVRITGLMQYDVQEIDGAASTVREYSTRAGQVFAVTWQGIAPPNLQQVLGAYYMRLHAAAASARASQGTAVHRLFRVDQSDFVMRSVARMRDFHGVAYIPALVPDGVSVDQLP
jgi:hypothetical protein